MIYIAILFFILLLVGNYLISKQLLYPPALFSSVWLASLAGLALSNDTFYPVSDVTLMVFVVGALAFSVGGLLVIVLRFLQVRGQSAHAYGRENDWSAKILDVVLVAVVIGFPFYWLQVSGFIDLSDPLYFAHQRALAVDALESSQRTFDLINNLPVLSIFLAIGLHMANDRSVARRWRAYLGILLALVYGSITGTKGNAIRLCLSLSFISLIRAGRVNLLKLSSTVAIVLLLFIAGLMAVNYAYLRTGLSRDVAWLVLGTIQNYWLGGLVAFERIVQDPSSVESTHHPNRFFLETANALGADHYVPPVHTNFTTISPSQATNTYTMYFSYFKDFGWIGTVIALLVLGGVLTWNYQRARRGAPLATAFYGVFASGLILTFQAEHFVLGLNFYIKMFIFFSFVYYVLPRLGRLIRGSWKGRHV